MEYVCSRKSAGFVEDLKGSGVKDQEYYFLEKDQKNGLIGCCEEWTVNVRDSDCSSLNDGCSRSSTHRRNCGGGASTTASGTGDYNDSQLSVHEQQDGHHCVSEEERTLGSIVFAEQSHFTRYHHHHRQQKESLYEAAREKCFFNFIDGKVLSRGRWS